jgi:hypothetical protein
MLRRRHCPGPKLTASDFAVDLNKVVNGWPGEEPSYCDPMQFFSATYATPKMARSSVPYGIDSISESVLSSLPTAYYSTRATLSPSGYRDWISTPSLTTVSVESIW